MKYTTYQYARALYNSTRGIRGAELKKRLEKFAQLLRHNRDLSRREAIERWFVRIIAAQEQVNVVTITSARKTNSFTKALNKNDLITQHIDPTLIGGMTIRINDDVWDGSVRKQLQRLREQIIS